MSNENNTGLPENENWLDDILGTETPKAELSSQELAQQVDDPLDLDKLMEESWDTDQQTLENIQDSVAQELPTMAMEEQFTTRIPFAQPQVSVEMPADQPTMAIPVLEQTTMFTPAQEQQILEAAELTQRFEVPQESVTPVRQEIPQPKVTQETQVQPKITREQPQPKQEQPKQEQPKQEQPKQEKPKQEQPKQVQPKQEQPKQEKPKQEQAPEKQPKQEKPKKEKVKKVMEPAVDTSGKARPSAKKGYGLFGIPHVVSTLIWLAIIVVAGVSLGRMLWVCCADVMAFGKPNREITVEITAQDVQVAEDGTKTVDIDTISKKLGDVGLIQYPQLFKMFATLTGKDDNLSPGTYTLNSYYDYNAMINGMSSYQKPREIVTVVIPEGYNCAQLFALLEAYEVCTVEQLEESAANGKEELSDFWFLEDDIPWGEKYCLEGYLFPDTYEFYTNDDPTHVLKKMLVNFDARFTDKMEEDLQNIKSRYGLSLREVLTIASMVEEEAVGATKSTTEYEGYNLASVYYNRLINKNGEFPTHIMGCDATVYYAMGDFFGEAGELTAEHLETDSPYNTRKYGGLPPGPITNPGSYSIYAALDPNETDYHYYVYDPDQKCHVLAAKESEFNKLLAELGY